jgi:signal transduction histidine kinase/AmiR/NasT family two-component response regulator
MGRDNLSAVLDAMEDVGVYVIERTSHRILYYNRRIDALSKEIHLGAVCSDVWKDDCVNCPLPYIENRAYYQTVNYNNIIDSYISTSAKKILWDDIPAYLIVVLPYKMGEEDVPPWFAQAKGIYAESMGILLTECFIVNLTEDFFVTCQIGGVGLEMSDRQFYNEICENYFKEVIHPEDMDEFNRAFSRKSLMAYFDSGEDIRTLRVRRLIESGEYHIMEYTARLVEQYGVEDRWCVLLAKDIHQEVMRERKKNIEMRQLAMAARAVYQSIVAMNLTKGTYGILENSNTSNLEIPNQGKTSDILIAYCANIAPEFQEEFRKNFSGDSLLNSFRKGKETIYMELCQKNAEGSYFWSSAQVVRVTNYYDDDVLAVFMCKSIEAERREQELNLQKELKAKKILEEALEKATEASLAKSEFLSKVSHDIRTPLNGILGMTALAQANMDNFSKLSGYLANIKVSGEHLLGLVNEILDVSKIENGKMELEDKLFDIGRLSEDVITMIKPLIEKKSQKFFVNIDPHMHKLVSGDEQRLRQVLVNILDNASKYSDTNGEIHFTVSERSGKDTKIGHYIFQIRDNGIGMGKDFLEHIYDPFARASDTRINKIAGTGLGMTIVKNVINLMGGDIEIDSKVGEGSCFTIHLFLDKKSSMDREENQEAGKDYGDFNHMRVLVAEDNDMNQEIMEEMIHLIGACPIIVPDGYAAVEAIRTHEAGYFNLILMDIRMPGMNGYETTEKIRALDIEGIHELPIIALTADAFKEDILKAKKAGMNGHASKPVTVNKLKEILEYCRIWGREEKEFPFYIESET